MKSTWIPPLKQNRVNNCNIPDFQVLLVRKANLALRATLVENMQMIEAIEGAERLECGGLLPLFGRGKNSGKPEHSMRFAQLDRFPCLYN